MTTYSSLGQKRPATIKLSRRQRFGRGLVAVMLSDWFFPVLVGIIIGLYLTLIVDAIATPYPCKDYTIGDVQKGNEPVRCAPGWGK